MSAGWPVVVAAVNETTFWRVCAWDAVVAGAGVAVRDGHGNDLVAELVGWYELVAA